MSGDPSPHVPTFPITFGNTQFHQTLNPHSVELTLTSAGKIGASVKVYDDNPAQAFERAAAILDQVRKRYPQQP